MPENKPVITTTDQEAKDPPTKGGSATSDAKSGTNSPPEKKANPGAAVTKNADAKTDAPEPPAKAESPADLVKATEDRITSRLGDRTAREKATTVRIGQTSVTREADGTLTYWRDGMGDRQPILKAGYDVAYQVCDSEDLIVREIARIRRVKR